jgi:hypothetical protein
LPVVAESVGEGRERRQITGVYRDGGRSDQVVESVGLVEAATTIRTSHPDGLVGRSGHRMDDTSANQTIQPERIRRFSRHPATL